MTTDVPLLRFLRRYSHLNWVLIDQMMVSGVNFLTNIFIARYLGAAEFGRFTLAWRAILGVNSFHAALILAPMMSIGPKQSEAKTPGYYGAIVLHQMVFVACSFVVLCGGCLGSQWLFPQWQIGHVALPLALAGWALQLQEFVRRYFFVRNRVLMAVVNDLVSYVGQIMVLFWLFQVSVLDSAGVLWIMAATSAAAVVVGGWFMRPIAWQAEVQHSILGRHWRFSRWLIVSTALQWIRNNVFLITAGGVLGAASAGGLKAGQTLLGATHIWLQGLENLIPARAAHHLQQGGKDALAQYLWRVGGAVSAVTALFALIIAVMPEWWLHLIYGTAYQGYGGIVRWQAANYVTLAIGFPLGIGLRTFENTHTIFLAQVCTMLFSLLFAIPLAYGLGVNGIAMGGFCQGLLQLVIFARELRKEFRVNQQKTQA